MIATISAFLLGCLTDIFGDALNPKKIRLSFLQTSLYVILSVGLNYIESYTLTTCMYYAAVYLIYYLTYKKLNLETVIFIAIDTIFLLCPYFFLTTFYCSAENQILIILLKVFFYIFIAWICVILIKRYIPTLSNFLAKHKELSDSIYTNLRRAVFVVITIHIISLENMNNSKYIVVIFCFFLICDYFMLTRKYKISKELFNEFKYIDKTYKENELYLTGYRKEVHEKKNQLLAIKAQVPKSYKDINAYIDIIIGKNSTRRKLFLDLNYICLPAAKNLLDFKIGEMV